MTDSIRTSNFDPPVKSPLVDLQRLITSNWHVWASGVATQIGKVTLASLAVDPPSIAANGTQQVTVSIPGVKAGHFVQASFVPGDAGVGVTAQSVTDGQVVATFRNFTGGAIDLPAGTLRLRIDGE